MPIDVSVKGSPGWWLNRLTRRMLDKGRQDRIKLLTDWHGGDPPMLPGHEAAKPAFHAFLNESRSNFAELIVEAAQERMTPSGIRTAAGTDETGDATAWSMWTDAGLLLTSFDVHDKMLATGRGYALVGDVDADTGVPLVTAEDPRQCITEQDPARPQRTMAAAKLYRDELAGEDVAYLYLPGTVFRATSPFTGSDAVLPLQRRIGWSPQAFDWDTARGGQDGDPLPDRLRGAVPMVKFTNRHGTGEFETHLPLLARINRQILHRMSIVALQAFKQRAIKGVPVKDAKGNDIDYADIFESGPDALWILPASAELWESGSVDISAVLGAAREDVKHLAAVSRTPIHMLDPSGENQSAEGAALSREGLVFRVEDRIARADAGWTRVLDLMFRWLDDERAGKPARLMWRPAERDSLAERASAASQLALVAPQEWIWSSVLQAAPDEITRMQSQRADQALLAPALTATQQAPAGGSAGRA